jgi:tRNA(Arg) A34 adenosine deaminase TadA
MPCRRTFIAQAFAGTAAMCCVMPPALAAPESPDPKWYEAAAEMRRLAESWGDQSYGAVVVAGGAVIGEGPSRVVKDRNPDAHAERVAILDAQRRLGRENRTGSVLYSTSRPCSLCEAAAFRAGVNRMYFGQSLKDAGSPGARPR